MPRKPPRRVQAVPRMTEQPTPPPETKPKTAPRRQQGTTADPPRSVRVSDRIWNRAKAKARDEGYTSSFVIQTLLDAYGRDEIEMPRIVLDFAGAKRSPADTARRGEKP